ncbi:GNAT family N-acetyltransferase [Mesorhizobium sp. B2-4-2]|nr:GNAT family N-acetyltransferase [Mesorhizobium sp. B2-6-6]TPJ49054.1 GNAT family N-acetyltransferase [Mesorhizobium sp. B2-6-4]TPJ65749.1 GNAT family N-acetyltransferase [Mesorhizobium sp. B2-6-1]TPL28828.1 GNAT family N-acetyltransferase [Mesorhizobium sp. B2-4-8]TPL61265.1 GNAT family N-acetyltransferase [Mesorhizobium sp. B2-4-2]TPL63718.1 GNAT family N-acetyltransferase [Mesorhizobium sp. B2-4-1]TPM09077.1 GNAT family N-acetyltransferase [Mesorhizobium sp. B2-3-8]TPM18648.1 GNAT famil
MKEQMLRSEIIGDPEQLHALAPHWWNLWEQSSSATPFQCPAWLLPWWRTFAPGELATVAIWRGNDLVGLAPLYLEHGTEGSKLLPIGISLSDYLDVLCVPGSEAQVATALAEKILSIEWSQWILPDLPQGSAGLAIEHPELKADGLVGHAVCPVLATDGDETLAGCVPARRRRQLRRARRAASRRGRVELSPARGDPQLFLDHLIGLHGARWAGNGGGVLADPAVEQFHRCSLPLLDARDLTRRWVLAIDGKPIGAYYGFHHRGRAYAYLGGFDPAYAEESPGAILVGHAIAESIREGAREFDFLRGQEPYKYGWGAGDRWTMRRTWTRK